MSGLTDTAQASAAIFGALAAGNVNVDMILQGGKVPSDGNPNSDQASLTFTVPRGEADQAVALAKNHQDQIGFETITTHDRLAKISVVGLGMRSEMAMTHTLFQVLADRGVKIHGISTSEIKMSLLVDEEYAELVVRALHTAFGLDQEEKEEDTPNNDRCATAS